MPDNLQHYYSRRAREYESIYHRDDPVRQAEQTAIAAALKETLRDRSVLEVACGTGYWTGFAIETANFVTATDCSADVLEVAREKGLPAAKVQFAQADAYDLAKVPGTFDAALANFWLSHVPRARVAGFLDGLHRRLGPGAAVFLADNVHVPGVGGELVAKPGCADTFKLRKLSDGSTHEVRKNYYNEEELRAMLAPGTGRLDVHVGKCFWWVRYQVG